MEHGASSTGRGVGSRDSAGDFVLKFSGADTQLPSRTPLQHWKVEKNADGWQFLISSGSSDWKGSPLRCVKTTKRQMWMLGELYPPTKNFPGYDTLSHEIESIHEYVLGLNGRFLICLWDEQLHQWHIWTDRFGTIHAYYATTGERSAVGTYFPSVAAAASHRQLDWKGLAGFFAFGFFPQDLTYYQDVRILRPASHFTFNKKGQLIEEKRYWQWYHHPDLKRSYAITVEQYAQIFEQVMLDNLGQHKIALPISGGLDSRSTVITINSNKNKYEKNIWAYSYGYTPDSVETAIAGQVAQARRIPFSAFTIHPYLFHNIEKILSWTEGFQDITQCRQAFVRDQIAANAEYLISALWGDVWHDDMGIEEKEEHGTSQIVDAALHKMEKIGKDWLLNSLVKPNLAGENIEAMLHQMVSEELEKVSHIEDPDFQVKAFKTEQWSFRWSLPPIRVFQSAAWPHLIFYDHRLTDFFCTVPTEYVSGRRLQIDHLKHYAPDLAKITWQVYDANLYCYQYFNSWQIPKRILKKAWRILTHKQIVERNWEIQLLGHTGHKGLEDWLLRPGLLLHQFVSPSAVRKLLNGFYNAPLTQGRGYTVSMLLTFSAWLETFG